MTEINLLPKDLLSISGASRLASIIKKIAIIGFSVFITAAVGAISFVIITTSENKNLGKRKEELISTINSQAAVEQKLVLLKNRISVAQKVLEERQKNQQFDKVVKLTKLIPLGSSFREVEIKDGETRVLFSTTSSKSLVAFMGGLVSGGIYKNIVLKEFSYSPGSGYNATLIFY